MVRILCINHSWYYNNTLSGLILISNSYCAVSPEDLVSARQIRSFVVRQSSWRPELKEWVEGIVLAREVHGGL